MSEPIGFNIGVQDDGNWVLRFIACNQMRLDVAISPEGARELAEKILLFDPPAREGMPT